jgi:hypothetical protein
LESSRLAPGLTVLMSMYRAPGRRPARIPSGPAVIAARAASSVIILNTTSAAAATSRGVSRQMRPLAMSALALDRVRFVPNTWFL